MTIRSPRKILQDEFSPEQIIEMAKNVLESYNSNTLNKLNHLFISYLDQYPMNTRRRLAEEAIKDYALYILITYK
jgi:hypothetical protein